MTEAIDYYAHWTAEDWEAKRRRDELGDAALRLQTYEDQRNAGYNIPASLIESTRQGVDRLRQALI